MSETRKSKSKAADKVSFEKSLERLEKIVADMESGELDLDTMIKQFEEGQKLIKLCQTRLVEVERKVEQLVKDADGNVGTLPFAEETV